MYDLNEFRRRNALKTMTRMTDPSTGTIPMKLADEKRDNKRKRLRYKPILVFIAAVLAFSFIGAVANLCIGFVDDVVYSVIPDGEAKFDIFAKGALFTVDYDFVLDLDEIVHLLVDGALFGLIAGLVMAIVTCIVRSITESVRYKRFKSVRSSLNIVRFVVCESFAKVKDIPADIFYSDKDRKKKGALFLTRSSLEFYDNDYLTPHRNFLVKLTDITVVESKACLFGSSKVIIYTTKGKYIFRVPMGTAKFWKRILLHAIQNGQRANFGR